MPITLLSRAILSLSLEESSGGLLPKFKMEVLLADEKLMEALEGDDSRVDNDHPGEFTLTNETAGAPRAEGRRRRTSSCP